MPIFSPNIHALNGLKSVFTFQSSCEHTKLFFFHYRLTIYLSTSKRTKYVCIKGCNARDAKEMGRTSFTKNFADIRRVCETPYHRGHSGSQGQIQRPF